MRRQPKNESLVEAPEDEPQGGAARRLITRRSQVQIVPPLLGKGPGNRAFRLGFHHPWSPNERQRSPLPPPLQLPTTTRLPRQTATSRAAEQPRYELHLDRHAYGRSSCQSKNPSPLIGRERLLRGTPSRSETTRTDREGLGWRLAALPIELYGVSLDMKMSVRLARLPSFVIAKKATNEFPARARPS
jgi:hypothetical protein